MITHFQVFFHIRLRFLSEAVEVGGGWLGLWVVGRLCVGCWGCRLWVVWGLCVGCWEVVCGLLVVGCWELWVVGGSHVRIFVFLFSRVPHSIQKKSEFDLFLNIMCVYGLNSLPGSPNILKNGGP